jgi:hypothetical protein
MDFRQYVLLESNQVTNFMLRSLSPEQQHELYQVFADSYRRSTGAAWDEGTFFHRAENWEFYGTPPGAGDQVGFVAVRPQRSRLIKLTGVAGSPHAVARGFQKFLAENGTKPIWGVVSADIGQRLLKVGFIQPPADLIRDIIAEVPFLKQQLSGIDDAGFMTVNVAGGVGNVSKQFYANRAYLEAILRPPISFQFSGSVKQRVRDLIDQGPGQQRLGFAGRIGAMLNRMHGSAQPATDLGTQAGPDDVQNPE